MGRLSPPLLLLDAKTESHEVQPCTSGWVTFLTQPAPDGNGVNQDGAAWIAHASGGDVFAVADGVGGNRRGAEATRYALEGLMAAVADSAPDPSGFLRGAILNGFERANQAVRGLSGPACTLAVVEVLNGVMRPYHVGDTMVVVTGQRGRCKHQTIPHGPVGYGVEAGLLSVQEAMDHEERNVVSNVVGTDDMRIEVGPKLSLSPRDTLLIASDGLFDNVHVEESIELVRKGPMKVAAKSLADLAHRRMVDPQANDPSKSDDLTFVIFRPER